MARRLDARRRSETDPDYNPFAEGWCIGQAKAERILSEGLGALAWEPVHLEARRKGDPRKVQIAEKLHLGAPSHVACLLYRNKLKGGNSENTLF